MAKQRRATLPVVLSAIFVALIFSLPCYGKPPNIIFILSDDLGYGDVTISPLVNRTHEIPTPNVQRLADEGMRFLRGYSGQVCAPSRCTLMTGRHLGHCTVRGNDGSYSPLLETDTTVASVLREKYVTGLVGKWGLGDFNTTGYPLEQGFDYYAGQASQVACHDWYPAIIQNNTNGQYTVEANVKASQANCGDHHSKCTWANDLFNREAVSFIRTHGQPSAEKPFFLFFSTTTPHTGFLNGAQTSWAVPGPYDTRFNFGVQSDFAAATSAQDDFVGAVLNELQALNIDEDTIVFFSGDNGPDSHAFDFFDDPGPFRGKKRSLHEGGVRQTIVARWPGHIAANSTTDHLFAFWDLLPTAAELAGVDVADPSAIDGISAAAVLQGQTGQKSHDFLYWEFCNYGNSSGLLPQQYQPGWIQALRYDAADSEGATTEWKAIRSNRNTTILLYNLTADISESNDVANSFPDQVKHAISVMEAQHVENKFWKSSQNKTDKCCASCFNHHGCRYPCRQLNTSSEALFSPPLSALSAHYLIGEWSMHASIAEVPDDINTDLKVHCHSSNMTMTVDYPRDMCVHRARIDLVPDTTETMQLARLSPSVSSPCPTPLTGTLHTDGNTLYIMWQASAGSNRSPPQPSQENRVWRKPGFDFD